MKMKRRMTARGSWPRMTHMASWVSSRLAPAHGACTPAPAALALAPGPLGSPWPLRVRAAAVGTPVMGIARGRRAPFLLAAASWTWGRSRATDPRWAGQGSGLAMDRSWATQNFEQ